MPINVHSNNYTRNKKGKVRVRLSCERGNISSLKLHVCKILPVHNESLGYHNVEKVRGIVTRNAKILEIVANIIVWNLRREAVNMNIISIIQLLLALYKANTNEAEVSG